MADIKPTPPAAQNHSLREAIAGAILTHGKPTAATICAAIGGNVSTSRVATELNAMRTDGLIKALLLIPGKPMHYGAAMSDEAFIDACAIDAPTQTPPAGRPDGIKPGTLKARIWDALDGKRLSMPDLALMLTVSRSQMHKQMSGLVEMGVITRTAAARNSYVFHRTGAAPPKRAATPKKTPSSQPEDSTDALKRTLDILKTITADRDARSAQYAALKKSSDANARDLREWLAMANEHLCTTPAEIHKLICTPEFRPELVSTTPAGYITLRDGEGRCAKFELHPVNGPLPAIERGQS